MRALAVVRPGFFTTVQDLGRTGASRWGVPPSGAADPLSAKAANAIADNDSRAALLEVTLGSIELEARASLALGIAGGSSVVTVNGKPAEPRATLFVGPSDRIAIDTASEGFRVYVAVHGGIDVPIVLGSRSTLSGSGFGGFRGRKLAAGDEIDAFDTPLPERRVLAPRLAAALRSGEVRVVAGPQRDRFPRSSWHAFLEGSFRVSSRSDRRGLRLEGEAASPFPGEIAPEGVVVGAVQVPPGGDPIVLMPDGPVTGGYPKIAVVISADLPVLGQWRPGERVRFREVTREEAVEAWRRQETNG